MNALTCIKSEHGYSHCSSHTASQCDLRRLPPVHSCRMAGGCGWPAGADGRPGMRMAGGLHGRRTACAMHWSRAAGLHARRCTFLPTDKFARLAHRQVCNSCPRTSLRGTRFTAASLCLLVSHCVQASLSGVQMFRGSGCVAEESWSGAQDAGRATLEDGYLGA